MSKTDAELRKLVDRGRVLKDKQDAIEVELDKIKAVFREEAKARKVGYFLGSKHFVRVSPKSATEVDSEVLYDTLSELDRQDEFWECIKVLVGEAQSKLGETLFNSISSTKSESYKVVSFLKSIPKKYME